MKWRTPLFHRAFDQGAGVHCIVAIIGERVAHQFGNHDRRGEVDDGLDPVFADQAGDQGLGRRCRR